jgi:hypothetical protein
VFDAMFRQVAGPDEFFVAEFAAEWMNALVCPAVCPQVFSPGERFAAPWFFAANHFH